MTYKLENIAVSKRLFPGQEGEKPLFTGQDVEINSSSQGILITQDVIRIIPLSFPPRESNVAGNQGPVAPSKYDVTMCQQ